MRIFVTGGAGYIGSVTAAELVRRGHEVVVYDSMEGGHRDAVSPGASLLKGDLSRRDEIEKILKKHSIEAVIHFAAYCLVGESVADPARYFMNNVSRGVNLLEAMRAAGTGLMIFSSSAAVYGSPVSMPIGEDSPTEPINPYGESKLFFEKILSRYRDAYGLNFVSLRYFNAAGATDSYGEDHRPETHLIPLLLKAALGRGKKVRIFGEDYETPDGTCLRDYIHVSDIAEAHILALGCRGGHFYNCGDGRGHSVLEVVNAAREVTGRKIATEIAPRRPGDPPTLIAGYEKIRRELGWEPRKTGLHEIIESAWRWTLKHPDGYTS